ncbi:uncharacterized protein TA15010 [Theileria annulata]|uniref:Uncharacterized protein n=1 Tax=Theileria annulata TaxID=5874 RepID=Q4UFU1_THEAN|nr:uncharacterized protein TA15010 [Theileria annulata]CAI74217.1 hypothetical protein TA15010 [Theileria annulata]|eukprot:XP_951949.1 hypothetical protein TA15010 [Theileria annulata]
MPDDLLILQPEINEKATQLQNLAKELKTASGDGNVGTAAGDLASNAQTLHGAASQLPATDGLTDLKDKATELATAAKKDTTSAGQDKESLYATATALQSDATDPANAIAVIEAFKKVKTAYEKLAAHPKYSTNKPSPGQTPDPNTAKRKVKAVETAWNGVKTEFENLCKALIKHYSDEVNTQATQLKNDPTVENARAFKEEYDTFKDVKSTIEIKPGDSGTKKTIEVTNLPHINDTFKPRQKKFIWIIIPSILTQWLNFLTYKLAVYPQKLKAEANGLSGKAGTLSTRSSTLETALGSNEAAKKLAEGLKEAASNSVSGKGLKELLGDLNKASGITNIHDKAKLVLAKYNEVVNAYNSVKGDTTATGKAVEFATVKSAFNQLQKAAYEGTIDDPSEGKADDKRYNGKAEELKTKAQLLHDAANAIFEAAKDGSPLTELRTPAGQLKEAAKSSSGQDDLYNAAKALESGGSVDEHKANDVIAKFDAVKSAYTTLSSKTEYKDVIEDNSSLPQEQQQKVKAVDTAYKDLKGIYYQMLNLSKLHKAAEKLRAAAQAASGLNTLEDLKNAADNLKTNVTTLRDQTAGNAYDNAKNVEDKFNDVKSAFNKLTADENKVQDTFNALKGVYDHIGSTTFLDLLIPNLNNNS